MKTLLIGKIWPEPSSSAAGTRTLDLLRALADWDLHFACAAQRSEFSADLEDGFGVTQHDIKLNDSSFDSWIAQLAPEVVIFDRYMTEEQFGWRVAKACPEALRVIDTSDLHFLREGRRLALKSGGETDLYNEISIREIASILRSDLSLIISEYECGLLRKHFPIPSTCIAYWPFCLELPEETPAFAQRQNLAMIGSFLHEPNWDAVQWCRREIWPHIRQSLPQAELHVYGSYTPEKAKQLESKSLGFRIKGRADDAIETLQQYRLNLAPLRFGAGLKGKLADAFVAGTPSIATPIAVEGMCGELPWGSAVSDQPADFAKAAATLYTDPQAWQEAQTAGFEIAAKRFAASNWLPRLPILLEIAHRDRERNRRGNFLGQMLNHHHHRSTEFMSRWIETKSKLPS